MDAFEDWAKTAGFHDFETTENGCYEDDFLQHCYLGWCAHVDSDRAKENACFLYNAGYMQGHEDTVDGYFKPIMYGDYKKQQMDVVLEIFHEITFRS